MAREAEDRNFDPSALTEFSAKYVVYGDRSSRSTWFHDEWEKRLGPYVVDRLAADNRLSEAVANVAELEAIVVRVRQDLPSRLAAAVPASPEAGEDDRLRQIIREGIAGAVANFDPSNLAASDQAEIVAAAERVVAARKLLPEEVKAINTLVEDAKKRPEVTAGYTFHRKKDDADYSELKILGEYSTEIVTFVGNASISLNHGRSRIPVADGQAAEDGPPAEGEAPAVKGGRRDTVRDYSISLSMEKKIPNFLPFRVNAGGTNEIVLSLSGKFMRLEDENDEIGVGQAKASFPLATGVDLPISVTYATRSEYVDEDEIRGNFGISVDTDKLWSLAKLAGQ